MGTMRVSLPEDLIQFILEQTRSGGYRNGSEVVRDALRLLRERRRTHATLVHLLDRA